jgi:hypothetical protein
MTMLSDEEFLQYVTSNQFSEVEGINSDSLQMPDLIHFETTTIPENTLFRNNLFAWLKATRIVGCENKYFDPYGANLFQLELNKNPLIQPMMRLPSYFKLFSGFPEYLPMTDSAEKLRKNQQDLDTLNEILRPQYELRNPQQFYGKSLYEALSSIAAYKAYQNIVRRAIQEMGYGSDTRPQREQAEYNRITRDETQFITMNQQDPNRHAGILEEWDIAKILDFLHHYLRNTSAPDETPVGLIQITSDYRWTSISDSRHIWAYRLNDDWDLFQDLTGYDFRDHLEESYRGDETTQEYIDWLDEQREEFDWSEARMEYPLTAIFVSLSEELRRYYGPGAEDSYWGEEARATRGAPHRFHDQKITKGRPSERVSQLGYGFIHYNPQQPSATEEARRTNIWNQQVFVPEGNDRFNQVEVTPSYTYNSIQWETYYISPDRYTFLLPEDEPDKLTTELHIRQGFTFYPPVNFINFLKYRPPVLRKD